ncbi:MAG: glutamate mutase L [Geminicoccaceae bacterium]
MLEPLRIAERAETVFAEDRPWRQGLLIDVGSTFTKALVIAPSGAVIGRAQAGTTIEDDVMRGVAAALAAMPEAANGPHDWALASSSAAGGLRMASVGLTEALSGQAGALAALGAGAKVVAMEHGFIDDAAIERIEDKTPHLALLAGGLDGGNKEALLHNAKMLSGLRSPQGFVIAGNRDAAGEAGRILSGNGRDVRVVDNVFPRAGEIAVTATREAVRELFLRHITRAKGLEGLMAALKADCEPTPLAVSRALNHVGPRDAPVVLVDLGGATTDVHSLGGVREDRRQAELPAPEAMRSVEGDLGMRWGAPGIVAALGDRTRQRLEQRAGTDLEAAAVLRHQDPSFLPSSDGERVIDRLLAEAAVAIALERHAGKVVVRHRPWGDRYQVIGKDLRPTRLLAATGGALRIADEGKAIVHAALDAARAAQVPTNPDIVIDRNYGLYAVGLLARLSPPLAERLAAHAFFSSAICSQAKEVVQP